MKAIYNEHDPFAAQWLRNLIAAGRIAPGTVDERNIEDLRAEDVRDAVQLHCFAGIGVWSYALKLAGVPNDFPVWSGSCPCQPFSAAGQRKGTADARHLWPAWFKLIRECRPPVLLIEQVEGAIGWGWLDLVSSDLEGEGYAIGSAVFPAAGVGAPNIRSRLYGVAYARGYQFGAWRPGQAGDGRGSAREQPAGLRDVGVGLADANAPGLNIERSSGLPDGERQARRDDAHGRGADGGSMGDASSARLQERERDGRVQREALGAHEGQAAERGSDAGGMEHADFINAAQERAGNHALGKQRTEDGRRSEQPSGTGAGSGDGGRADPRGTARPDDGEDKTGARNFWSDAEWIYCRDGKYRPVESRNVKMADGNSEGMGRVLTSEGREITFPLIDGAAFKLGSGTPQEGQSRTGQLRGYGNALNAEQAAAFIRAAFAAIFTTAR